MNKKKRITVISCGEDARCELCGKLDELRPYGPNGEAICFKCGMKDEETTRKQFIKIIEHIFDRKQKEAPHENMDPITNPSVDRGWKICQCHRCGVIAQCTPSFDFYEPASEPGVLICEHCMIMMKDLGDAWR